MVRVSTHCAYAGAAVTHRVVLTGLAESYPWDAIGPIADEIWSADLTNRCLTAALVLSGERATVSIKVRDDSIQYRTPAVQALSTMFGQRGVAPFTIFDASPAFEAHRKSLDCRDAG